MLVGLLVELCRYSRHAHWSMCSDVEAITVDCELFHTLATATGKAWLLSIERRVYTTTNSDILLAKLTCQWLSTLVVVAQHKLSARLHWCCAVTTTLGRLSSMSQWFSRPSTCIALGCSVYLLGFAASSDVLLWQSLWYTLCSLGYTVYRCTIFLSEFDWISSGFVECGLV